MLTWAAHAGGVTSVAFVPGGGLLSTGTDGVLRHWDAATGAEHRSWKLAAGGEEWRLIRAVSESTGRYAVVGIRTEGVRVFDLSDGNVTNELRWHRLYALAPSPAGDTVFCAGIPVGPAVVAEVRPSAGRPVFRPVRGGFGDGAGLAIAPDGSQVIIGRNRLAWPSGKLAGPVSLATGSMFAVSPDGDKLFGANGARLMVWGMQTGAVRQKLKGHLATITGLTTTPGGRKLWTASADATVRRWDVETYRCEKCYALKVGPLGCVAVSPDGLTAAAGSAHSGRVAVWDLD
jgi:WD40 repeat protein